MPTTLSRSSTRRSPASTSPPSAPSATVRTRSTSLVAPLSLVNALIVACSYRKEEAISKTFANLEEIWDEYGVYEKVDDVGGV